MLRSITKFFAKNASRRDVVLALGSLVVGGAIGWAISHHYYLKSVDDLKADAEQRKKEFDLLTRGIENVGGVPIWHRDLAGRAVGVMINFRGAAVANVTASGTLTDAPPEPKKPDSKNPEPKKPAPKEPERK